MECKVYQENAHEEFFDTYSPRRAVSSGSPSLDGSLDDEDRGVCSDSEILNAMKSEALARQVKGPSSGDLEHECERERIQATKAEVLKQSQSDKAHDHNADNHMVDQVEWEDLLGSGHLLRKILHAGHGDRPEVGRMVTIRVKCTTNEVDNHDRLSFLLGFAYGELGLEDKIPANQPQEGIDIAEKDVIDASTLNPLRALLYANLSACYMKIEDWTSVLETTEKSLMLNRNNSKVLFRQAQANIHRKEYDGAIEQLKKAIKLDPQDKFMPREFVRIQRLQADYLTREKKMYRRMLNGIEEKLPRKRISLRHLLIIVLVVIIAVIIHLLRVYLF